MTIASLAPLAVNPNTIYVPFTGSTYTNFQFQATLDGKNYICIVTWNLFGERYYINIYDTSQNLILCAPLIGSPSFYNISLTAGYFTTSIVWRVENNQFEIF
jgi:hypothetical protein